MMFCDVSTFRSGLDEVRGQELRFLSDAELEDELRELDVAGRVIAVERARRVAEVERRGSFGIDGHLSVASWVESRFGTTHAEAAREVRMARALEELPAVREALVEGEVSSSAVGTLLLARDANPDEFAKSEELLLDAARTLPVRDLRRAVEHWKSVIEPDACGARRRSGSTGAGCMCLRRWTAWFASSATSIQTRATRW